MQKHSSFSLQFQFRRFSWLEEVTAFGIAQLVAQYSVAGFQVK